LLGVCRHPGIWNFSFFQGFLPSFASIGHLPCALVEPSSGWTSLFADYLMLPSVCKMRRQQQLMEVGGDTLTSCVFIINSRKRETDTI
jgi:hypothetical protein